MKVMIFYILILIPGKFLHTFVFLNQWSVSCEGDKTIKIYKEDEEATEESNPILWKPEVARRKRF